MYPTVGETLEQTAEQYPDRPAVLYPRRDQRWTFAEFDAKVNRLANALADLGIEHGDRVSTMLHNGTEIALAVYACAKLGAVFNPLNYRLPAGEVTCVLDDAESELLIFEEATRPVVEDARPDLETVDEYLSIDDQPPPYARGFYEAMAAADDVRPDIVVERDDPFELLYTSGTTGRPKGVLHDHHNVLEHTLVLIAEGIVERGDVGLSAFPLYHAAELHGGLLPRVHVGATNVIHHDFDPGRVLNAIDTHDVTVFFAPPVGWKALQGTVEDVDADVSSLRLGIYAAAPMPADVLDGCLGAFDANYLQAYGMTEVVGCVAFLHPVDQVEKQGSAGVPALHHSLRIVEPGGTPTDDVPQGEVGEIIVAGPYLMREYWNRPDTTEAAFRDGDGRTWYYTGDLGYFDDDGYLFVVDRKDDLIITGGENVYPAEVETVLFDHPAVVETAVVGEPDAEWGERVVAYVVGDATASDLDRFLRDSDAVADFKRPRRYYFVDELPKNPSGKIQKFKLQDGDADLDPDVGEP